MQQQYVIHAHYDELYRFVYYLVDDTYTANEIVQDTFVKFIQPNRSVEQPRAYVFKMAYHPRAATKHVDNFVFFLYCTIGVLDE